MKDQPYTRNFHVCQSVSGALKNWTKKEWRGHAEANGLTADQMKERFRALLHEGVEVLPIGKECDGFDYKKGCPGHPIEDAQLPTTSQK